MPYYKVQLRRTITTVEEKTIKVFAPRETTAREVAVRIEPHMKGNWNPVHAVHSAITAEDVALTQPDPKHRGS